MAMAESDQLVEVLKEIRDELRAVRTELAARGGRLTASGIRTEVVAREGRWRSAALAAVGVAGLALGLGLAMRGRPAPASRSVAVAPPAGAVIRAQAPVVSADPEAAQASAPVGKLPARAPPSATTQAGGLPAGAPAPAAPATTFASVPVAAKRRVKPDAAANPLAAVASDEDETISFPPPARRGRVHRLSYRPVEWEPAKL
jgi:hypothetical protein